LRLFLGAATGVTTNEGGFGACLFFLLKVTEGLGLAGHGVLVSSSDEKSSPKGF